MINPDLTIDVPPIHLEAASGEADIRYTRYGDLVLGQEAEEEEHLDPPYIEWKR